MAEPGPVMRTVERRNSSSRIMAMMVLRVVLAITFLGITTWFQLRGFTGAHVNFYPLYGIVVTVGLLTIIYSLALSRISNQRLFVYLQVSIDILLVTAIVYATGGTESYLPTLYLLSVIGASMLLGRRGGLYAASFSSIAYGVLIDMDFYGVLPGGYKVFSSGVAPNWVDVFTTVSTNILAFYVVAYLTGYLAERADRVERRLEEKEVDLERLELLNRQIVENITSGIMTLDGELRITSFNTAAEHVTGYTLREVYYRSVDTVFEGLVQDGTIITPIGTRGERTFRKKGGEEVYLGYTVSPGRVDGEAVYIVIFQDLTRLRGMEEQIRRDDRLRALGELSVGIAHEIRNPLASISGSIQLLDDELKLESDNHRLMEIVLRETGRLNELITDFLLFAKPAHEKRRRISLTSVIRDTLEMFRNSPESRGLALDTEIAEDIYVDADERQIGQVFWNLFLNAAHAMRGSGRLKVVSSSVGAPEFGPASGTQASGQEGPGLAIPPDHRPYAPSTPVWPVFLRGHVMIKVVDSGPGIEEKDINRIFDPFFSTKETGSGLGLAIVHRIVESHGGAIDVTSTLGEGTAFRVTLPLSAVAATEMQAV